jgi:hypothetical protein
MHNVTKAHSLTSVIITSVITRMAEKCTGHKTVFHFSLQLLF